MSCYIAAQAEQKLVIMSRHSRPAILIMGCTLEQLRPIHDQLSGEDCLIVGCTDADDALCRVRDTFLACVIIDMRGSCPDCLDAACRFRELLSKGQHLIGIVDDLDDENIVKNAFRIGFDDVMSISSRTKAILFGRRIRRLTENTRLLQRETEQHELNVAIHEIITKMANALRFDDILECILNNIGRVVEHDAASISIIDGGILRNRYTRGYSAETTQHLATLEFPISEASVARQGVMTGKTQVIKDTRANASWISFFDVPEAAHGHSVMCAPIKAHGQVIGFIYLDLFEGREFNEEDGQRMDVFADQAAIALTNAALYDTIAHNATRTRQLQQATSLLLNTQMLTADSLDDACLKIAETVISTFQALDCGVMLVNWETRRIERIARAGQYEVKAAALLTVDSNGLVAEAVRTGETVYSPDVGRDSRYVPNERRTRSELVIPLTGSHQVLGVLDLQSTQTSPFSEQDIKTLRVFADHAGSVLENLQLIQNMRTAERADAILNYSSDAILLVHQTRGIQQINPACSMLFACTLEQLEGEPLLVLADESDHLLIMDALASVFGTGGNNRVTITARRKDGNTFAADIMLSPMFTPDRREIIGAVCSVRDITVHKQLEEDLQAAVEHQRELLELKTLFVRHASHELRTPLSVISTSVDLLLMAGERKTPEERTERLNMIQRQIAQLKTILDELLDLNTYQKLERGQLSLVEFDMELLCHEAIAQTILGFKDHPHQFTFANLGTNVIIEADRDRIGMVLKQLLSNAATFSDAGTRIDVSLNYYDDVFEIQVQDQGIGIPKLEQKRIFEPFYRVRTDLHERYSARAMGAGLGLTIAYHVVTLHGGWIQVESEEYQGTTATVFLPATQPLFNV